MTKLKKILALVLTFALLASLISCGEYKAADKKGDGNKDQSSSGGNDGSGETETDEFTVNLTLNGQPFNPPTMVEIYWNDGYNVYKDTVDENGFASMSGLDGDYSVTLSSVPEGYAYDANGYTATNDNRHIVIEMYELNLLRGQGTSVNDCYTISDTGVYTVTITGEGDYSYIRFTPQLNGVYTVESWVSISEDQVSPICKAYLGSAQFVYGEYLVEEVGACGSYTRNFIHEVTIASENISSGGGGSQAFTFAVGAETKSGAYPVNLTFAIKRNGDFDIQRGDRITMFPTHDWSAFDFNAFNALAGGKLVGAETLYPGTTNSYVFDQSNYKVWEVSEGGDGVYHVFDEEKYPETGGYGPILVVYITEPCRFVDRSFTTVEDAGNNNLVVNGYQNYRLMIKGFEQMASEGYFCTPLCLCHEDGSTRACLEGCQDCYSECNNVTAEERNVVGYAEFSNGDGVAPVTPEIKEFLQSYSTTQRYFADGGGWVDGNATYPVDAFEDSQWLFACAYYVE